MQGDEELALREPLAKMLRLAVLRNVRSLAHVELAHAVEVEHAVGDVAIRKERAEIHRVEVRLVAQPAPAQLEEEQRSVVRGRIDEGARDGAKMRLLVRRLDVELIRLLDGQRIGHGKRIDL